MNSENEALKINETTEHGVRIVSPEGKLDTLTAKDFESHLLNIVETGEGGVLVEMSKVDYVTSFGLRSLLIIAKKLNPFGRKLVLYGVNPSVLEVFRISGFLKILIVEETKDKALAKVGA